MTKQAPPNRLSHFWPQNAGAHLVNLLMATYQICVKYELNVCKQVRTYQAKIEGWVMTWTLSLV